MGSTFIREMRVDTSIRGFQYFLHIAQLFTIVRNRTFNLNLRFTLKVFSALYIKFSSFLKRLGGIVREEARYISDFFSSFGKGERKNVCSFHLSRVILRFQSSLDFIWY